MKKVFFFAIVFATMGLTSCTETPTVKDLVINTTADTTIGVAVAKTAPRWGCNGKILPQDKLVGYDKKFLPIEISKTLTLNGDSLQNQGWFYYPGVKNPSRVSWEVPGYLVDLTYFLLWLIAAIVVVTLLYLLFSWLFRQFRNQKNTIEKTIIKENSELPKTVTPEPPVTGNKNSVTFPPGNNNVYIFIGGRNSGDILLEPKQTN